MKEKDIHLEVLKLTIKALGDLQNELVFVGGATISLFITEPEAIRIRETYDVDCVVEAGSRSEYEKIAVKLRKVGFVEDHQSHVICRFRKGSLILDVMPTESKIFGFSNRWYKEAIEHAETIHIFSQEIKVFSVPFLVASKIEAFKGRGKGDFMGSHDLEDIVTLMDGRREIAADLLAAPALVRSYLKAELSTLADDSRFIDSLDAHISDRTNIEGRKKIVLARIRRFLSG